MVVYSILVLTLLYMQFQPLFQAGNGAILDRAAECWKDFACKCRGGKSVSMTNSSIASYFCLVCANRLVVFVLRLVDTVKT